MLSPMLGRVVFSTSLWMAAALVGAAVLACGSKPTVDARPPSAPAAVVSSNVLRADYAGSKTCEPCHAEIYAKWAASPMRRMTRRLAETQIDARFDGSSVPFHDDAVVVEERDGRRFMRITSATHGTTSLFRVTKVIGGRYREDFVGVEVTGTGPDDKPVGDPADEPVLPLSWLKFDKSWRYKGYSVMAKERPRIERGRSWRQTCIFCHNTAPLLATLYDDLLGPTAKTYQGSVTDNLLPASRRWTFAVQDDAALAAQVGKEIEHLTAKAPGSAARAADRLAEAIHATERDFKEPHLVEVGIGCEACHGGSREHAARPVTKPSYLPVGAAITLRTPGGGPAPTKAQQVNHVCARCHTVLFSRYAYTWEGGERRKNPGGSSINSGEARDFLLGHCASQLSCTTCHDPHTEDARAGLEELGTVAGNRVCVPCHAKLGEPAALAAHSHHDPKGEGGSCVACHMARKNTGLAYRLTRYHRIGSPTDAERVERDRPLECALCHADKSVASLLGSMEQWYGKRYDRDRLAALYGDDLTQNALLLTLARGKAHEQMAAAGVLGDRGEKSQAAPLLSVLVSDFPLARYYAKAALEKLESRKLPVDLNADTPTITREATRWLGAPPR